jgi:hypothetical protein
LRRIKLHERMMSLGKTFFEADFEQKARQNHLYPHPPIFLTAFSTIKLM